MSKLRKLPFEITLQVRDSCLCLHLQRAARAVARHFDNALRPLGLTNGQFSLLMSLNRPEPAALGSVSTLLAMDRTTLTANLKPLQRRGLLRVTVDPNDKRSRSITLTSAGSALLLTALPAWERTNAEIVELLVPSDCDRMRDDLRQLAQLDGAATASARYQSAKHQPEL
jgi:DNA-binding MarR family transcriptional regulator